MTITAEQATAAAQAFLKREPFPGTKYRWVLRSGRRVSDGWYFDYTYERVDGCPLTDADWAGGAPGFLVGLADAQVRVVGWPEYAKRQLGEG